MDNSISYKNFTWLCLIIPILIYFVYLQYYWQDIPHWDDYAIINFVNKWKGGDLTFTQKIQLLFSQHNEHRIVFTRLIALLSYVFCGAVNLKFMMFVGSLALVVILFVFAKILKYSGLSLFYLIPACFILFHLGNYENSYWAMASVQNFWVVAFSTLAFYKLSKNEVPYLWAFLSTFTSANASVLVPIIGLALLMLQGNKSQTIKFALLSALNLLIYFASYTKPPDSQPINFQNPFQNIKATVLYLGSIFNINTSSNIDFQIKIALFFGVVLIVAFAILIALNFKFITEKHNSEKQVLYFFIAILLFCLGTAAMSTLSRMQYGMYVFLVSRYKIYGSVLLVAIYILAIINVQNPIRNLKFGFAAILSMLFFGFSAFYFVPKIHNYQNNEMANYYNSWHKGRPTLLPTGNSSYKYISNILDQNIDSESIDSQLKLIITTTATELIVKTTGAVIEKAEKNEAYFIEFLSKKQRYIFACQGSSLWSKSQYFTSGLPSYSVNNEAHIPLTELPTEQYFINVIKIENNKLIRYKVNYYLEVEGIKPTEPIQNW